MSSASAERLSARQQGPCPLRNAMRFWECRRAVRLLWLKMSSRRGLSRARHVGADDLVAASDLVFLPGQGVTLGVTVEHLGATMWTNSAGQYVATSGFDWGSTNTMQHNPLNAANAEQDADLSAVAAVNASGWPDYPVATVRPGALPLYLGEGGPLYAVPSPGLSRPWTPPRRPACRPASPRGLAAGRSSVLTSHPPVIATVRYSASGHGDRVDNRADQRVGAPASGHGRHPARGLQAAAGMPGTELRRSISGDAVRPFWPPLS
jgi:hypothetical protein